MQARRVLRLSVPLVMRRSGVRFPKAAQHICSSAQVFDASAGSRMSAVERVTRSTNGAYHPWGRFQGDLFRIGGRGRPLVTGSPSPGNRAEGQSSAARRNRCRMPCGYGA